MLTVFIASSTEGGRGVALDVPGTPDGSGSGKEGEEGFGIFASRARVAEARV